MKVYVVLELVKEYDKAYYRLTKKKKYFITPEIKGIYKSQKEAFNNICDSTSKRSSWLVETHLDWEVK